MELLNPYFSTAFVITSIGLSIFMVSITLYSIRQQKLQQLKMQVYREDEQRRLLLAELTSRENERSRVSKDLHDSVGVMLQALSHTVFVVASNASDEDKKDVQEQVNDLIETVRRLSFDLMPAGIEKFGFVKVVEELCNRLNKHGMVPISFVQSGKQHPIHKQKELMAYRIVQEAVNNALRHAKASAIVVRLVWGNKNVCVYIEDNGVGMPQGAENGIKGVGTLSMKNRAILLDTELIIKKNTPSGTIVMFNFLTS